MCACPLHCNNCTHLHILQLPHAAPTDPKELATVVDLGAKVSKGRSDYDTGTATFWALGAGLGGGSSSVSGIWLEIAQRVRG